VTRLYFANGEGNDTDPILTALPAGRRETLIAKQDTDGAWRLDIVLQGENETVFFDL
jgi:protocatechuate 3,4-dioxygenase alpha subunit